MARWIKIAVATAALLAVLFVLIHPFVNLAPSALRAFRRGQQVLLAIGAVMCAAVWLLFRAPAIAFLPVEAASSARPALAALSPTLLC